MDSHAGLTGTLVLVVGPSGAGKDTLIDGARHALAGDPGFHFVRRSITRPAGAGGEDHEALHERDFAARRIAGDFALWWEANGLSYGLPRAAIDAALARGACAVANASRGAVARARESLGRVHVVLVTASPDILARRLAGRGRESAAQIEARLERGGAFDATDCDAMIRNDGDAFEAITRFVGILRILAAQRQAGCAAGR